MVVELPRHLIYFIWAEKGPAQVEIVDYRESGAVVYHDSSAHSLRTDASGRDAGRGISEAHGADAA
jgi:hypothetical protein